MDLVRVAAVAALVALAGCGSDDPAPSASTTATTTSTAPSKAAGAEPKGKLSRSEYRSLRAAYKLLVPLDGSNDVRKLARIGNRACIKLTTQTELLAAVHSECVQAMRFYRNAAAMVTRKAECERAAQAGDVSCFADLFRSLGRSARVVGVRSAAVNRALRKRAIRGECAKAIGSEQSELRAAREVQRAGIRAAHALEAKNRDAFERAAGQLQGALGAAGGDTSAAADYRALAKCV